MPDDKFDEEADTVPVFTRAQALVSRELWKSIAESRKAENVSYRKQIKLLEKRIAFLEAELKEVKK